MALPMIETGYKPEFGLGAVYQGFNAANADNSAELEIIKQFLANQREQQMQPLDVNIKQTESDRATVGRSPEMLDAYQRGYIGQNDSQAAAGTKAQALLPFAIAAEQSKAKRDTSSDNLFGRMFGGMERQYDQSLPEKDRIAAATEAVALANTLKQNDPKFLQNQQISEMKDDTREYIAELNARRAIQEALMRNSGGDKPVKSAEEALARQLTQKYAAGQITYEQYMAELASIFNAKNAAKVQPGTKLDLPKLGDQVPLTEKPPQQTYTPNTGAQQQPATKLSPEQRKALIDKITKGQ